MRSNKSQSTARASLMVMVHILYNPAVKLERCAYIWALGQNLSTILQWPIFSSRRPADMAARKP